MAGTTPPRGRAVALQIREHLKTKELYYAVVAAEDMASGSVGILSEYDPACLKRKPGTLAVTFIDELNADADDLQGYEVHVSSGEEGGR